MKTLLLTIITGFLLFLSPESKVQWLSPATHDFGEVIYKKNIEHQFHFKNTSSEAFVIDNVRTSCGCTAADWQETPILPDSSASIQVVYDANELGYFRKSIKVYFSGQRKAEKLYLEGTVVETGGK